MDNKFIKNDTAWCPGCGNFSILNSLKNALDENNLDPSKVLLVGGIGQAAKTPQYLNTNTFCGLHGRALPAAVAAKIANKSLTVIVNTGDGDSYGEGGNHFIHNIRRNVDISHFVHNNQIYGLTKGQSSPTTDEGHITGVQTMGNKNIPLNPVAIAIIAGAGFVARGFSGNPKQLTELMKNAIDYRGYALIDILQPCVSFNKINTMKWYKDRIKELDSTYNPSDKFNSLKIAMEWGDIIYTGILYQEEKDSFIDKYEFLKNGPALVDKKTDFNKIKKYINEFM